ncbi:MAG: cytochrome c [Alphaproteobacteria bacterium]|nr:cytochrome c [Alphaproteobacteria bacterium]
MARQLCVAILLVAGLLMVTQAARAAGDAEDGKRVAERWCAGCHVVDGSGRSGDAAPAFAVLAQDPAKTEQFLRTWISHPHPPMPNFNLTRRTVDDLVAYIRALKVSPKGIRRK